jgi:hypothetical protein
MIITIMKFAQPRAFICNCYDYNVASVLGSAHCVSVIVIRKTLSEFCYATSTTPSL